MNDDWKPVATALIGSWPSQVGNWGNEGMAAYISELAARGLSPDAALVAIRSCPAEQKFPPSAPELAGMARRDPDQPTFDEMYAGLYHPGGIFGFKRAGVEISPWVAAFAEWYGHDRLRLLPVDDPDEGKWARKSLQESYEQFCEASEGRQVAEVARGRRGKLGKVDPLVVAGLAQIEAGS